MGSACQQMNGDKGKGILPVQHTIFQGSIPYTFAHALYNIGFVFSSAAEKQIVKAAFISFGRAMNNSHIFLPEAFLRNLPAESGGC